jgi:RNA polymerase sigma factor (sigma-70 family)
MHGRTEGTDERFETSQQAMDRDDMMRRRYEDIYCRQVLAIGIRQARRQGLGEQESEDCAMELVIRMLQTFRAQNRIPVSGPAGRAWLQLCARNHVLNYFRGWIRHGRRSLPLADASKISLPCDQDGVPLLEESWDHEEFWRRIREALGRMQAVPAEMLIERYCQEMDVKEIAAACGRTPEAIRQSLHSSRKRLRKLLEGAGATEATLRDLI